MLYPAVAAAACLLCAAAPLHAQVDGRIVRVGLFEGAAPIVRNGDWSFAEVELRYIGSGPFGGELRLNARDRDGDVVTSVTPVALTPDGAPRSYFVYFAPNDLVGGASVRVELFDENGRRARIVNERKEEVGALDSDPLADMDPEDYLIVDLSVPRKLPHAAWLDTQRRRSDSDVHRRRVRGMSPRELPPRWIGLDAADAVVWDDADPSNVTEQQIAALLDWVRAGGRLLLTSGNNWQRLVNSPLAEALPVTITGVSQVTEALEFRDLIGATYYDDKLRLGRRYLRNAVTRCQMTPREGAMPIPAECANPQIAYRRLLGRGAVTFLGASLLELLPPPPKLNLTESEDPVSWDGSSTEDDFVQVCERIVGRNLLALPLPQSSGADPFPVHTDLFADVRRSIGFEAVGAAFLIFAILFAVGYTAVATFGSYAFLKKRSWQQHCWTAFALVSIAGSVVGTGMVWLLRGFTTKLMQTTVIDAAAGATQAYAACLLGVKTPRHTALDLRLPVGSTAADGAAESGPLRVVPKSASFIAADYTETFVAPENYQCLAGGTQLAQVPQRATLKEYAGEWQGDLPGTLDARLVAARQPSDDELTKRGDFAQGSYIRNRLGVELAYCYLIWTDQEVSTDGRLVHCAYLGRLGREGPEAELNAEQLHRALYFKPLRLNAPPERVVPVDLLLDNQIRAWRGQISLLANRGDGRPPPAGGGGSVSLPDVYVRALLLSAFDLMEPETGRTGLTLRRSHGRGLGCAQQLTRHTAMFIGYSEDPPTPTLYVDDAPLRPSRSQTVYRFTIPIER